jgi:uncharacterized membrane protein
MKNNIFYVIVALVLVVLLALLSDAFMVWMSKGLQMITLLTVVVFMVLWAGFIMHERAHDEREAAHIMQAGRIAYLSGILTLTLALVIQGLAHAVDPWISFTLAVMVLSKLAARLILERSR